MASTKRPKGMPAGLKNTPGNRKEFQKQTSKKAGGPLPQRTKAQAAKVKKAEGAAKNRAAKADKAVKKANASGKPMGKAKSDKMFRRQAKARRLSKGAAGGGG